MKKKIKISLILSLAIIFGCFSNVFAATNQTNKVNKIAEVKKSVRLLDNTNDNGVDQYTKLLMHMDDMDNDTFKDERGNAVINNNVTLDTTNKKFGNGSASFNGTSSYLTIPASTDWNLGNKDFTLECWARLGDIDKGEIIECGGTYNVNYASWALGVTSKGVVEWYCSKGTGTGSVMFVQNFPKITDNLFHHYEIDRQGSNFYLFLDGNIVNTVKDSSTIKDDTQSIFIGHSYHYFKGNIDELRLSVGIARHTSDFTPDGIAAEAISLNKYTDSLPVGQTDTLIATVTPDNATNKNVNWTSSDPTIVNVDANGKITALKVGTATITATTTDGTNLSKSCVVTVNNPLILNIEPEKTKINLNDTVSANLTIDNIQDIAAEDIRIKYDSTKLQFLNYAEVDGIKLVENDVKDGELRFILASKGKENIIDAKKILLKLNFKGIAAGDALVDVTNGRVSDGITKEWDLTDEQCGQATITIQKLSDVNNSGEYTLLDLGIDARHEGEDPSTLPQYNTDQDGNKAIDDDDLTLIGKYMLENVNYTPNNIK